MHFTTVQKRLISQYIRRIGLDLLLLPLAYGLAQLVFGGGRYTAADGWALWTMLPTIWLAHIGVNLALGLYRRLWAFAGLADAWLVLAGAGLATAVLLLLHLLLPALVVMNGGTLIMGGMLAALLSTAVKYRRFGLRQFTSAWPTSAWPKSPAAARERALIVGTNTLARQLALAPGHQMGGLEIVGFVDGHVDNQGMTINGLAVVGGPAQIPVLVEQYQVDVLILAEETADPQTLWQLIACCQETPAQIKVLPDVDMLMTQDYRSPLTLRDLSVEDLLGRKPLPLDWEACRQILAGKVVLVTGAAGSIGSELCRQLCQFDVKLLLALDNNETGLFDLALALERATSTPLHAVLADVVDWEKVDAVFRRYQPQVVFHAAAYKHVPLMEAHPEEALRVNVRGTMVVSEAALAHGAERFVFISSDKAVHPSSVMGASKYLGERWLQALAQEGETTFTAVRFGNVIGSRGSVLPIFKRQIEAGGPVTVTHREMKRFFMSIPEAVNLVLQAATLGAGGEVFMLDMGDEVSIQELAERMIRLRGLRVHKDIAIDYIGIRPGEKLREQLSYRHETCVQTAHPRIFALAAERPVPDLAELEAAFAWLLERSHLPPATLRACILGLASEETAVFMAGLDEYGRGFAGEPRADDEVLEKTYDS